MLRSIMIPTVLLAMSVVGTAAAAEFPHEAHIKQIAHWEGTYNGYNDGRRARLTIEHGGPGATDDMIHAFRITLEDLDRNETFEGRGTTTHAAGNPTANPTPHIMDVGTLQNVSGSGQKDVNRLLLHTWDTSHISGSTQWRGTDYGLSFSQ